MILMALFPSPTSHGHRASGFSTLKLTTLGRFSVCVCGWLLFSLFGVCGGGGGGGDLLAW